MEAIIRLKGKGKGKTSNPKGGIIALEHQLKSALKSQGIESVPVRRTDNQIIIPMGLPRIQLEGILTHIDLPYEVKYQEKEQVQEDSPPQTKYPADYGLIKGRLGNLKTEKTELERILSETETQLQTEKGRNNSLQTQVQDLKARYNVMNVNDFLSEMMLRENNVWENFVKSYTETMQAATDLYNIPVSDLEKNCLDYQDTKNTEFEKIKPDFEKAKQAQKLAEENPYLKLDPNVQKILTQAKKIQEKNQAIKDLRDELVTYAAGKVIRIALNTGKDETIMTLPFKKHKEGYHRLEQGLIDNVNQSLTDSNLEYIQEDFNGLLRYRISAKVGTVKRNKLLKAINSTDDAFAKLCGKREVIGIETYNQE